MAALPHAPYIQAVVDRLAGAGLQPSTVELHDSADNAWDAAAGRMLTCRIGLNGRHPAVTDWFGVDLVWEHPAPAWQRQRTGRDGEPTGPLESLPGLPLFADPDAVLTALRAALADRPLPQSAALWPDSRPVADDVQRWARAEALRLRMLPIPDRIRHHADAITTASGADRDRTVAAHGRALHALADGCSTDRLLETNSKLLAEMAVLQTANERGARAALDASAGPAAAWTPNPYGIPRKETLS